MGSATELGWEHWLDEELDGVLARPVSRRAVLGGLAMGAVGLVVPGLAVPARRASAAATMPRAAAATGLRPYRLAMHVHASFSEGLGSMCASLAEADRTHHDLVFFTDHDFRKQGYRARQSIEFVGPDETEPPMWIWIWHARGEGAPRDPGARPAWVSGGAEHPHVARFAVAAPASGEALQLLDAEDGGIKGTRSNVVGQRITLDVRLDQASPDTWLELRLYLSLYPAIGGQPGGQRVLVYRFGPGPSAPGSARGCGRPPTATSTPAAGSRWRSGPSRTSRPRSPSCPCRATARRPRSTAGRSATSSSPSVPAPATAPPARAPSTTCASRGRSWGRRPTPSRPASSTGTEPSGCSRPASSRVTS